MSHNSNDAKKVMESQPAKQTEFVEKMLTGSQAKTAFALRKNCETLINGSGRGHYSTDPDGLPFWMVENPEFLNSTGFLTLTVGDYHCNFHGKKIPDHRSLCPVCGNRMFFEQVKDVAEASRRFNSLNSGFLKKIFPKSVIVTERHKTGAIHYHLLGRIIGHQDIRTGLNFAAIRAGDYRSAPDALRAIWGVLRDTLPKFGFGRAELLPIEKTSEAVASYVSKYIEKNVCNRLCEDKRKKLVRYSGWEKSQLKPNEFSWATPKASAWRFKTKVCAALVGADHGTVADAFGPRWAFGISRIWQKVDGRPVREIQMTWPEREVVRLEMVGLSKVWAEKWENARAYFGQESWELLSNNWQIPKNPLTDEQRRAWVYGTECEKHPIWDGLICENHQN
jgi:hypothetical protein